MTTVHTLKSKVKISQNFVAFSEYMNFISECFMSVIVQNSSFVLVHLVELLWNLNYMVKFDWNWYYVYSLKLMFFSLDWWLKTQMPANLKNEETVWPLCFLKCHENNKNLCWDLVFSIWFLVTGWCNEKNNKYTRTKLPNCVV